MRKLFLLKNKSIRCESGRQLPPPTPHQIGYGRSKWNNSLSEERPSRMMQLIVNHDIYSLSQITGYLFILLSWYVCLSGWLSPFEPLYIYFLIVCPPLFTVENPGGQGLQPEPVLSPTQYLTSAEFSNIAWLNQWTNEEGTNWYLFFFSIINLC